VDLWSLTIPYRDQSFRKQRVWYWLLLTAHSNIINAMFIWMSPQHFHSEMHKSNCFIQERLFQSLEPTEFMVYFIRYERFKASSLRNYKFYFILQTKLKVFVRRILIFGTGFLVSEYGSWGENKRVEFDYFRKYIETRKHRVRNETLLEKYMLLVMIRNIVPVTVTERSKAWTVFARSEAGIVGSNPTEGMDFWCVYVFILCLYCPGFR
jgi:hypothetical protein